MLSTLEQRDRPWVGKVCLPSGGLNEASASLRRCRPSTKLSHSGTRPQAGSRNPDFLCGIMDSGFGAIAPPRNDGLRCVRVTRPGAQSKHDACQPTNRSHPREQRTSLPVGPWRRLGAHSSPPRGAPIASSERFENERPNKLASQSAFTRPVTKQSQAANAPTRTRPFLHAGAYWIMWGPGISDQDRF
jgi:hypothetical protein